MTHPKTSVPWGHDPDIRSCNAWDGTGQLAVAPAHDLYSARELFGENEDHFLGGRLPSGPPVNNLLPIVGQPVGPSLLTRVVGPGSKGDEVSQLQQFLNGRLDPPPGLTDHGFFDAQTMEAVQAFQKASGINPTGKVESKTWFKLLFGGRVPWPGQRPKGNKQPFSAAKHPIAGWAVKDKFDAVFVKCGLQLPGDLRFTFQQMVDYGTRQGLAVILTTWSGALLTNGNEATDFGLRALLMGQIEVESLDVIEDFNACLVATSNASQQVHLEHAATYMARVVTRTGVALFLALIHRVATKHEAKQSAAAAAASSSSSRAAGAPIDMRTGIGERTAASSAPAAAPPKPPVNKPLGSPLVGLNWHSAAKSIFPGQQSYQNCGLQSSRQVIEQAKGQCLNKTELEFLDDAIKSCGAEKAANHPVDSGGTSAAIRKCVLKQYGVESTVKDATVANVEDALKSGKGIIISADVSVLWQGRVNNPGAGRHAVVITHGVYDREGHLIGVSINDTGINKRYTLTKNELQDVLDSGSGSLNVTDKRIWPTD